MRLLVSAAKVHPLRGRDGGEEIKVIKRQLHSKLRNLRLRQKGNGTVKRPDREIVRIEVRCGTSQDRLGERLPPSFPLILEVIIT